MKKIALFLLASALASPALANTWTLSGWSAAPGQTELFTIKRTDGSTRQVVTFYTSNGTAQSGVDYEGANLTFVFDVGVVQKTVLIEAYSSPTNATGTLTFFGTLTYQGSIVSTAGANINEPNTPQSVCWDGSIVTPPATCPSQNPAVGQGPGLGAPDVPTTDHNVLNDLQKSWGTGAIPASNAPDVVGAFRFICAHNNLLYDDPTVYPGQPGASHLHDQTGVDGWNANSNYVNLRQSGGGSKCNDVAGADHNQTEHSNAGNRTPYWQPALLDGKGNVILPDFTAFYYKRRPLTDPVVSDPTNPQYQGKAVPLPQGIKFIFGAFPSNSSATPVPTISYACTNGAPGATYPSDGTFAGVIACAKNNPGGSLLVRMTAPDCWDGVNLDFADHRSHVAYGSWSSGYYKCDAGHPYVIPAFTYAALYTILPTDNGDIHWSSDEMDNTKPRGWSFHVDYGPAAWDPIVKSYWENGCLDRMLNCSGGDLGNGLQLKGASQPIYYNSTTGTYTQSWRNPNRLVLVPVHP